MTTLIIFDPRTGNRVRIPIPVPPPVKIANSR